MKTIFKNLLGAIGIMCYFIVLNFAYTRMNTERLMGDIEVFSGIFLVLGILMLERAYKKDDGKAALTGVELLCFSLHSLSIGHVITFFSYDFQTYLLTSSCVFASYYVLKAIIIYTKDRREYLKGLSDISEIVKEEPVKKEAKKKSNKEEKKEVTKKTEVKEEKTKKSKKAMEKTKVEPKSKTTKKAKETKQEKEETKPQEKTKSQESKTKKKTTKKKVNKKEETKND